MALDAILQALGAAGTVLDTPGSVARGALSGQFGRALGGIFDPSQRVYGEEWTGNPWTGAIVDMALDPTAIAGGVAAGLGGKAVKALTKRAALTKELAGANVLQDAIRDQAMQHIAKRKAMPTFAGEVLDPMADLNKTYNPTILEALPDFPQAGGGRLYTRVKPDLADHINKMGLGARLPQEGVGGSAQMVVYMDPKKFKEIAKGKGGKMGFAGNPKTTPLMKNQDVLVDAEKGLYGRPSNESLPNFTGPLADEMLPTGGGWAAAGLLPIDQAVIGAGSNVASASKALAALDDPGVIEKLLARLQAAGVPVESPLIRALAGGGVPAAVQSPFRAMHAMQEKPLPPDAEWAPEPLPFQKKPRATDFPWFRRQ